MEINNNLIFKQLFDRETSTYTYLIGDYQTKDAIIIDPVLEQVERDINLIKELDLNLKYILDTHVHADHITGSSRLREQTKAKIVQSKASCLNCADILLENDSEIEVSKNLKFKGISTPGHTNGCMSYLIRNWVFTGDTLMIRSVARTDFQQGSPEKLYDSIFNKLYKLEDNTIIYPAHDYNGHSNSSILEEKRFNKFAKSSITKKDFISILNKRKLPLPKKINTAVPSNEICGEKIIEREIV